MTNVQKENLYHGKRIVEINQNPNEEEELERINRVTIGEIGELIKLLPKGLKQVSLSEVRDYFIASPEEQKRKTETINQMFDKMTPKAQAKLVAIFEEMF